VLVMSNIEFVKSLLLSNCDCVQYDEFVPSCLTTKHGGFYVNFGQLDFREVSDDSNDGLHRKKKIKRVCETVYNF